MRRFDAVVIGAGPAGSVAALYLARFGVTVALVEKLAPGGLLLQTFEIENYPGFPKGIKGYELADALSEHLEPYGNLIRLRGELMQFTVEEDRKRLLVDDEWIESSVVIIASGVRYRKLGVSGEDRLLGRGISHCALCDGNFFRNQRVGVMGGGNSAIEESLHLAKIASTLHVIHRRDVFRAAPIYVDRLKALSNVVLEYSTSITRFHGETRLEGVTLKRLKTGEGEFLPLNGVFIFIGFEPVADGLPEALHRDERGFVVTDAEMRSNIPGVFAAGDVRAKLCRQAITAAGDGATAANSAFVYLEQQHG